MKLTGIECFLLDLDGTLYLSDNVIEGATEAVERMRSLGKVVFLTNNTSKSRKDYMDKLMRLGFYPREEEIFTAAMATIRYLDTRFNNKRVYLLGNDSLRGEFEAAGIRLTEESPDVAVVGFDTTLTYNKLIKICDFVRRGVSYIATHPDINCPVEGGYIPDVGSFLKLIEASAGRLPETICGKPYIAMAEGVKSFTGIDASKTVMVGDRLMTDMKFAANNGFKSVLVLSGESTREDLSKSGLAVDLVVNSVKDFMD